MINKTDFSALFYNSSFPILVYDLKKLQILDANEAALNLYGFSKNEFLDISIAALSPTKEIPEITEVPKASGANQGKINFGIVTHQKSNGACLQVNISGYQIQFEGKDGIMLLCKYISNKETELSQSKEATHIMNASLDVICSIDADGNFISVSEAAFDLWGFKPETLVGKAYLDLVHKDDKAATEQTAEDIMLGKSITTFENRYIKKNGEIAYNYWSARWDSTSKIMYAIARNANEKRKADHLLIENKKRFEALVQEGSDVIAIIGNEEKYTYVSPTSISILGYTPEELIGTSPFDHIHPKDAEQVAQSLKKIETEKRVNIKPFRFKNKSGQWRWIETILTNMKTNASIQGIIANSRDITDKRKEVQHLKLLQSVITHTNDAVLITEAEPQDEPGPKIIYVNEAFTRMTGYTANEVVGKSPRFLQGPKSDRKELARLAKAMRKFEPCEITTINYKKSGEEFWVNFAVSPVANENGWYTHWIAIERDVTVSKNQELQRELLGKISTGFNLTTDLYQSLNKLSQIIAAMGDFSFSEIWLPSNHKNKLRLFSSFTETTAGNNFYNYSTTVIETEIGQGLQGSVWDKNQSLLWGTVDIKKLFLRGDAAKKAAIKSVLGIPLTHLGELAGVLLVGSNQPKKFIQPHQPVLTELGKFIGTEIKRKRLENDMQHLFEALPDLVCLTDFNGKFLKINKAGCEILGFEEHTILEEHIKKFAYHADIAVFTEALQQLKNGETIFTFENRCVSKNNEIIWLSWNCNAILEEGIIYATAKNITEEKKLLELVADASQLSKIAGWEVDLVTNSAFWSKIMHQLHETDSEKFTPTLKNSINFYREDYKEYVAKQVDQCISLQKPFDFEAPLITAKGNQLWIRAIGKGEYVNGECIRIFGSFQDINTRKETELRLKSITDDLPGVSFQYYVYQDGTDKLTSVSEASKKIWRLSPEECEQNNSRVWEQIKKGGDYESLAEDIQKSVRTQSKWNNKWKNILPNDELRWHEGYGTPYRMPDGTILFNSMIFDITDKVKASQLYEQASSLAKIGSWELDLSAQDETSNLFWSPMVKKILEVDNDYNPSLTAGLEFYRHESRIRAEKAGELLIKKGTEFDLELQVITKNGKEKWVRCIGKSQVIQGRCTKIFGSFQDINSMKSTEIKLSEILGSISDAFYALDENWNFTYFNKEAENLLHRKSTEVLGKTIWEEFPAAKDTELETVYRTVIKTGKPQSFEYLYPEDANWYEINVYPSSFGLSSYFKNISERKRITSELQRAFEEKNNILESIGDAFFTVDNNWIVTYWNKVAEQLLNRKRENILGQNLWDIYPDAVVQDFYAQYHKAMVTGQNLTFEEYYPNSKKWFEVSAYPKEDGLSVYFKDITLRKETDIRILQANERFEKVAQATTDAIWDWDIENDLFYRGEGFENLFGYKLKKTLKAEEVWKDTFHPDDLPRIQNSLKAHLQDATQGHWQHEYRILHKSGEEKSAIDKGVIIRNEAGKAIRMVGAITDITHRVKFENEILELNELLKKNIKELEISNEELEQFAFIASHDLQEPLRMITSFLNQIERKYRNQLDDKALQYIHYATDGAKRMKQIILDLLDYSKAGKIEERLHPVDLNKIVAEYRILRRRLIEEKEATISINKLPKIMCFRAPLTQTLHCLIDNAIKYTGENTAPLIKITAEEAETHWEICVADNGIGIDSEFYDKIFIIFQRLHNRDKFTGTGIGLSIAKKHIEAWGGKIWITSEIGKGSRFYFTIGKNVKH